MVRESLNENRENMIAAHMKTAVAVGAAACLLPAVAASTAATASAAPVAGPCWSSPASWAPEGQQARFSGPGYNDNDHLEWIPAGDMSLTVKQADGELVLAKGDMGSGSNAELLQDTPLKADGNQWVYTTQEARVRVRTASIHGRDQTYSGTVSVTLLPQACDGQGNLQRMAAAYHFKVAEESGVSEGVVRTATKPDKKLLERH
jgi:hypothetical protein